MASNTRDFVLGVGIKATGQDSLQQLAREVRGLAKSGDDAAPAFQEAADQLARLAKEAGELEVLRAANQKFEQLTLAEREAAAEADKLRAKLAEQRTTVESLAAKRQEAIAAVNAEKDAARQLGNELVKLNLEYPKSERGAKAYKDEVERLLGLQSQSAAKLDQLRTAQSEATRELNRAEATQEKLGFVLERAAKAQDAAATATRRQQQAMQEAQSALQGTSLAAETLAEAEAKLLTAQQKILASVEATTQAAQQQKAAREQAAATARAEELALQRLVAEVKDYQRVMDEGAAVIAEASAAVRAKAEADEKAAAAAREAAAVEQARVNRLRAESEFMRQYMAEATAMAELRNKGRLALLAEEAAARDAAASVQRYEKAKRDAALAADREFAEAIRRLRAESEAQKAAAAEVEQSVLRAGEAVRSAFGQAGVRSLRDIEAEMVRVGFAADTLQNEFRAGRISADDLNRALGGVNLRLQTLQQEANNLPNVRSGLERLGDAANQLVTKFGALAGVFYTVWQAVAPVVDATVKLDQLNRTLTTVTGSSASAAKQIEFLRNVAQASGQQFTSLGDAYGKFAASALSSGISLDVVQKTFANTAIAAGNLGLTTDQVERALQAMSQMASKGVVSMEELRGQLGDALPAVLPLLAKQLGVTEQQLTKIVESGQLLAKEALPALGVALATFAPKDGGPVQGLVAEFNRLVNVVTEAGTTITGGAFGKAVGGVLGFASERVKELVFGVTLIGESFTVVGQQIGVVIGGLVSRDFELMRTELDRVTEASNQKMGALANRIGGVGDSATGAGKAASGAAEQVAQLTKTLEAQAPALAANAEGWVDVQAKSIEALKDAEKQAVAAEKLADAKKLEGEAIARVVALSGNEIEAKKQAAQAATAYSLALQKQVEADEKIATLSRDQVNRLRKIAEDTGRINDEATKKQLEQLELTAKAKEADVEKTKAQAEAARAAALAAQIHAETLRDNSGNVAKYTEEVAKARLALERAKEAYEWDQGKKEDVEKATVKLARAEALLKDAIDDATKQMEFSISIHQADQRVKEAGIQQEISRLKVMEQLAIAQGDEATRLRVSVSIRQAEVELQKLQAAGSVEEAQLRLQNAQSTYEQAKAAGELTPEQEREYQLRIANAKAALAEAEAKKAGTAVTQAETDTLRRNTDEKIRNLNAARGQQDAPRSSGGLDTGRGTGTGSVGTVGRGGSQPGKIAGVDGSGNIVYEDASKAGSLAPTDAAGVFNLLAKAQGGQLTAQDEAAIRNALAGLKANQAAEQIAQQRGGMAGTVSAEGRRDTENWIRLLEEMLRQIERQKQTQDQGSAPTTRPSAAPAQAGSYTVNVNLGNSTTSIRTASQADADKLAELMRQLTELQGRSA